MSVIVCLAITGMCLFMLCRRSRYRISLPKTLGILALLVLLGVSFTYLLYFIENGEWGGMSFFGAVLFVPVVFPFIARLFRTPAAAMLDFVSLPGLLMFAVLKINCAVSGCCIGRILWQSEQGSAVFFPSPIVEAVTTVLLVFVLSHFERIGKTENRLYPISLIAYGTLRFILNFFRAPEDPFLFGLQKGNVWALVAIVTGGVWLLVDANIKINKQYKEMQQAMSNVD